MNANLSLRAMTLRGIGSYLHGARLDIRPFTILCGTNGSGKSTWFKALNMLKDSILIDPFPFSWSINDCDEHNIELTNAFVHLSAGAQNCREHPYDLFTDKGSEDKFGPAGTIGLEFEVSQAFSLPEYKCDAINLNSIVQAFLWSGKCAVGMCFRIRIAHPTIAASEGTSVPGLYDLIELRLDNRFAIRFSSSYETRNRYTLECSAAFLPEFSSFPDNQDIQIAELSSNLTDIVPAAGVVDLDLAKRIAVCATGRIRELLKELMSGYFYISAIREIPLFGKAIDANANRSFDEESPSNARYVGPRGEATWRRTREFGYNHYIPDLKSDTSDPERLPYLLQFISAWLGILLDTRIIYNWEEYYTDDDSEFPDPLPSIWWNSPTGFLAVEKQMTEDDRMDFESGTDTEGLLDHRCFWFTPQTPMQMSAGLHQLAPLIVQLGLMRRCEVMAVENPEVHLHPKLQLQVAEFLLHQAKSGKWIIIETHSDLIVRRVLREILEEKIAIGQQKIAIYFADIENSEIADGEFDSVGYKYSTLKPIEIDERGRIVNWPAGFMDDDVKESRRLLDIMYGEPPDGAEDDE